MIDENFFREIFSKNTWVRNFFLVVLIIIFLRVGYLQLIRGNDFFQFSQNNQIRKEYVPALRGLIYDRRGKILADHGFRFDVIWVPQYVKEIERTARFLSNLLSLEYDVILNIVKKHRDHPKFLPITIAESVSENVVATLEAQKKFYDGIDIHMEPIRVYPHKGQIAHALGYVSQVNKKELHLLKKQNYRVGNLIGKKGVELIGESYLRGISGVEVTQVDAHGRRIKRKNQFSPLIWHNVGRRDPVQGRHLQLTLDLELQKVFVDAFQGQPGAGIVVNIHTGEVLAMASLPSYDPNVINEQFYKIINRPEHPLLNKAIQGTFPPGSTYKILAALAGLKLGLITKNKKVNCSGSVKVGSRHYHCWKASGHGELDLLSAIAQSCDVYFYELAKTMDVDRLARLSKGLGFGQILGIELRHERAGIVPTRAWKQKRFSEPWQGGETLSLVIGQGFLSQTPLQIAMAFAAMLNGGSLLKPYLISSVLDENHEGVRSVLPTTLRQVRIEPEHLILLKKAMVDVMEHSTGTGYLHRSSTTRFGGKTGTAQVRRFSKTDVYKKCSKLPFDERHHGLFVGFWPVDDPKLVALAVREHGCSGSKAAIPIVRAVFEAAEKQQRLQSRVQGEP
jgi:penicillin-binding protein 2